MAMCFPRYSVAAFRRINQISGKIYVRICNRFICEKI